jgi:hypothetical protein
MIMLDRISRNRRIAAQIDAARDRIYVRRPFPGRGH